MLERKSRVASAFEIGLPAIGAAPIALRIERPGRAEAQ